MSRVGKNPVTIPDGVNVTFEDGLARAKGKLGELTCPLSDEVETRMEDGKIWVSPRRKAHSARALWGTTRAQIQNMVTGVTEGYSKKLQIVGVGYRAQMQGKTLKLSLGFSHDIEYPVPEDLTIKCASNTEIEISGASKQKVGQVASEIRGFRPPEPYKGKGVKYAGEWILMKEGKKK